MLTRIGQKHDPWSRNKACAVYKSWETTTRMARIDQEARRLADIDWENKEQRVDDKSSSSSSYQHIYQEHRARLLRILYNGNGSVPGGGGGGGGGGDT